MKKEHFEILLEEINSKFNLVLEGHESLRSEIRAVSEDLNGKYDLFAFKVDTLNKTIDAVDGKLTARIDAVESTLTARIDGVESNLSAKLDAVASDLSAHRADTEVHRNIYCVKED